MLSTTMQVGGVSTADVGLEQMLAALPDLDDLVRRLRPGPGTEGRASAAGRPRDGIRFSSVAFGFGPEVAPEITIVPPGRSDFTECDQVAAPTVSITASTRSGSRAPLSKAASAPSRAAAGKSS